MVVVAFMLVVNSGKSLIADSFQDDIDYIEAQSIQDVGRDAKVAAYDQLLRDYPDHPDRAKAMLQLQGVWQNRIPKLGIEPDAEKQSYWVKRAYEAAPLGSEVWFESGIRHAGAIMRSDPEEAKRILNLLHDQAPDGVDQARSLYELQGVARWQNDLQEAERICLYLQHWTLDKRPLPDTMLRKGDVFLWIQESAVAMMAQYADLREFKAQRIARINNLVDNHVSVGVNYVHRERQVWFDYLDKVPEHIPGLFGQKVDLVQKVEKHSAGTRWLLWANVVGIPLIVVVWLLIRRLRDRRVPPILR